MDHHWSEVKRRVPVLPLVLILPVLLAGCGAPPAFVIASLAIDTAVFASTGKSPAEHVLSAVVQQDCAVYRLITKGALCAPAPSIGSDPNTGLQEALIDPYIYRSVGL